MIIRPPASHRGRHFYATKPYPPGLLHALPYILQESTLFPSNQHVSELDEAEVVPLSTISIAQSLCTLLASLILFLTPGAPSEDPDPGYIHDMAEVESSWVVHDLNPRTNQNRYTTAADNAPEINEPRYYHLASMTTPEGYTQEENFTISSDENDRALHYTANEPGGTLEAVYVCGVPNKDPQKHAADVTQTMSAYGMTSEIVEAKIAGVDLLYTAFTYPQSATESYASLCIYLDTPHDACLIMVLNSYVLPTEELPALDALLTEAEALLPLVTIEK